MKEYFGVLDDPTAPVFDKNLKQSILPLIQPVVPAKTPLKSHDHNYLLVTLGGCTKEDFKLLQTNSQKLKLLLNSVGKTISTTVLMDIKNVQKNVALFKICVKKANQMYSPFFPAVVLGDAAVTPHPETGSGLVTGFRGFEELQKLLFALSKTHRSEDNLHHFLSFDESYHLYVAEKALKGTWTILDNLVKTVEAFRSDLVRHMEQVQHRGTREVLRVIEVESDRLIREFRQEMNEAEELVNLLMGKGGSIDPGLTISRLWMRIGETYQSMKEFTAGVGFLDERLDALKNLLG